MLKRLSWDKYFISMSKLVAKRSTCLRRHVGVIIAKDKRILATGYNGAPVGFIHCDERGCIREREKIASGQRQELCRGLHAEQNAIIQAALYGINLKGASIYSTHQPCVMCAKMIISTQIKRIIFIGEYPDKLAMEMLKEAKIEISLLGKNK